MARFIEIPASKKSFECRRKVHGVGINDADYLTFNSEGTIKRCPYYQKWTAMLTRCYSEKCQKRQPAYIGCTVAKEWHLFSNFKKWMESQDWEGKQLDKDILINGNKIYSPESCIFVLPSVNLLFVDSKATRGDCPQGVLLNKDGRYKSQCNNKGRNVFLGYYDDKFKASMTYMNYKYQLIISTANEQKNIILKNALLKKAEVFKEEYKYL